MNSPQVNQKNKKKAVPKKGNAQSADTGDGVNHINIWAHGKTELGKLLAHFSHTPFKHPYFGPFNSMEGFWYYIKTEERDDALRRLSGKRAKDLGKQYERKYIKNFHEIIITANFYKIEQNPRIKELMIESTLPFQYYYLYGEHQLRIDPPGYEWLVKGFEEIRTMLKEGRRPPDLDYSAFNKDA
jgi:hypothetical protein